METTPMSFAFRNPQNLTNILCLPDKTRDQLIRIFTIGEQIYAGDPLLLACEQNFKKAERINILGLPDEMADYHRSVGASFQERHIQHLQGLRQAIEELNCQWPSSLKKMLNKAAKDKKSYRVVRDRKQTELVDGLLEAHDLMMPEVADLFDLFHKNVDEVLGNYSYTQMIDLAAERVDKIIAVRQSENRGCERPTGSRITSGYHAFEFDIKVIWEFVKGLGCFLIIYCWFEDDPGRWVKRMIKEYKGCRWVEREPLPGDLG